MEFLKNFLATSTTIHPLAEEVTIYNGRIEENLFDILNAPKELLYELIYSIGFLFNEGIDLEKLDHFSFQNADGIGYFEPKLMLVYPGGEEMARALKYPVEKAHDHYCINYFLHSKTKQMKFYDLIEEKHPYPALPAGSIYAAPYGRGVSADGLRKDVYFVNKNLKDVAEFFRLPLPTIPELFTADDDNSIEKLFGLTYETKSLRPLKLKRYFYPHDPNLKRVVNDEVFLEQD